MNGASDRQRMLETADALQAQLGKQFSMSALYNECGLSRHLVRRHFPTKAALLNAVAEIRHTRPEAFVHANFNTSSTYADSSIAEEEYLSNDLPPESHSLEVASEQEVVEATSPEDDSPVASAGFAPAEMEQAEHVALADEPVESMEIVPVEMTVEQEQIESAPAEEESAAATAEDILWGPEDSTQDAAAPDQAIKPTATDSEWIERRFRVFEKAISILEDEIVDVRTSVHALQSKPIPESILPASDVRETVPVAAESPSPEHEPTYVVNCEPGPPPRIAELELEYEQYISPKPGLDLHKSIRSVVENANIFHEAQPEQSFLQRHRQALLGAALVLGTAVVVTSIQIFLGAHNQAPPSQPVRRPVTVSIIDATGTDSVSPSLRGLIQTAQAGDAVAQTKFGLMLLKGESVPVDHLRAARWIESAAEQGNSDAEVLLGNMYAAGVQPNPSMAYNWYLKAATKHNPKAMHNLGIALITGSGVKSNHAEAASWFMRAALLGYTDSAFNLAVLLERGDGVSQNTDQALHWYHYAAAKGDAEAAARESTLKETIKQIASN